MTITTTTKRPSNEVIAELLRQKSNRELKKLVNAQREVLFDALLDAGIANIFAYYESVAQPAQYVGGYLATLTSFGIDESDLSPIRDRLQLLAVKQGRDSTTIDTEGVAKQIATRVHNNLLKEFSRDIDALKKAPFWRDWMEEEFKNTPPADWRSRVQDMVEAAVCFVKTRTVTVRSALTAKQAAAAHDSAIAWLEKYGQ